jgi:hypothetical protein
MAMMAMTTSSSMRVNLKRMAILLKNEWDTISILLFPVV